MIRVAASVWRAHVTAALALFAILWMPEELSAAAFRTGDLIIAIKAGDGFADSNLTGARQSRPHERTLG